MAANTTKTEFPELQTKEKNLKDNDKKVVDLYIKGLNAYRIADEVYGFDSEEAVRRVTDVVRAKFPEE